MYNSISKEQDTIVEESKKDEECGILLCLKSDSNEQSE